MKTTLANKLLRSLLIVDAIAVFTMIVGIYCLFSMQSTLSDVVESRWVTADMSMEYWIGSLTKVWALHQRLESKPADAENVEPWAVKFVNDSLSELRRTDPGERDKIDRLARVDARNDELSLEVRTAFEEETRIRDRFLECMMQSDSLLHRLEDRVDSIAADALKSPNPDEARRGWDAADATVECWVATLSLGAAFSLYEQGRPESGAAKTQSARAYFDEQFRRLRSTGHAPPGELDSIQRSFDELQRLLGQLVTSRLRRNVAMDEFDRNTVDLRDAIEPMEDANDEHMNSAVADGAARAQRLRWVLIGVTIVALGATIAIGLQTARSLTAPISELNDAARDVARGKLDRRVPVASSDELGELAQTFNDMASELARSNARLEQSEAAHRNLFDNAVIGLYRADADGRVRLANRRFLDILGCDVSPGVPHDVELSEHFLEEARWRELSAALETQGEVRDFETEMRRPDGRRLDVVLSARRDSSTGTIEGSLQDVTDRRLLEQQIVQKEKLSAIGQLAAGISHEMRNPLGIVSNALYDLRQIVDMKNPEVREDLSIATEELNRLNAIIGNLLDFSRESGSDPEPVDVRRLVERTVQLMAKSLANQNVEVVTTIDDLPHARFNANAFKQIFINLVTNAAQAMPDGGRLTIRGRAVGDQIELEIEDTGVGIKERDLPRIFNPFFTTKAAGKGTGLGLSIVHSTLRKYDGDIRVRSIEGHGTTFCVRLPVATEDEGKDSERV
ncbi:MAG: HAMP domain-containing protein [Planctomycetes bacterium]|nr:HAMP domain-containing protein [Planctomycetota bacterium]MBI3846500.1 HAMP domain-containing protein [Planctomycetota bacterium]